MPNRPVSRTASIPSKYRSPRERSEMQSSLTVKRLDGMASLDSMMSSVRSMASPTRATLAQLNSSRLKSDLKKKLADVEYDQRSFEVLLRLLKAGPFIRDVINDENTQPDVSPPYTPAPSLITDDTAYDDVTDSHSYVTEFLTTRPIKQRSKPRPLTTDSATRFRKSIEELKEARERFGVCMSVNGAIARARNVQQKNERSRRKAGREKLPNLNGSLSSGDSFEGERNPTPRVIPILDRRDSWLTLSGQKIKLKHQGHVQRVLGQAEHDVTKTNYIQPINGRPKRSVCSAPPKTSLQIATAKKFAWAEPRRFNNKSVINRVSRTLLNNRSALSFSNSFHVFDSYDVKNDNNGVMNGTDDTTKHNDDVRNNPNKVDTPEPAKETRSEIRQDTDDHDSVTSSRPNSAAMPRPVRSIIIKLPDSVTVTSSTTAAPVTTQSRMTSRAPHPPNASKPSVKFAFTRREEGKE